MNFIEVGIPTTLREIGWPKASFAKASFSQFWSTIPSQACQLLEIRTWVHETWGQKKKRMNETFNERYTNNPNTFQFQQKMPSMSTVPRDVVNFDPIWPPQDKHNNVPENRYEEDTSSKNYFW